MDNNTFSEMPVALAYVRVSGKTQVYGLGFQRQEELIHEFATSAGFVIAEIFREDISGTVGMDNRPQFQAMLARAHDTGVKTIVVEGMDRLAREFTVQDVIVTYLAARGMALYAARTGENVVEAMQADPMRRAMAQIQAVFAELEKNMQLLRMNRARDAIRATGRKCGGRRGLHETKHGQEIIRLIRSMRRLTPGQRRLPYAMIAQQLNEAGHRTLSGKPWTAKNVENVCVRHKRRYTPVQDAEPPDVTEAK